MAGHDLSRVALSDTAMSTVRRSLIAMFILCSGHRTFTVFALDTHKSIAHPPMPAGADVVKLDLGLSRIYVACSSGFISVFQAQDAVHYRKLEDFPVQKMVHSLAVDSASHPVY